MLPRKVIFGIVLGHPVYYESTKIATRPGIKSTPLHSDNCWSCVGTTFYGKRMPWYIMSCHVMAKKHVFIYLYCLKAYSANIWHMCSLGNSKWRSIWLQRNSWYPGNIDILRFCHDFVFATHIKFMFCYKIVRNNVLYYYHGSYAAVTKET